MASKPPQKSRSKSAQKAKPANSSKRSRGRPSDFKPEFCDQAEKLCRLGATDADMADFFGKDVATIGRWKLRHAEFCEALKRGKSVADMEVADRLYQRALGYTHESEKVFQFEGAIVRAPITKHYAPDVTAGIFWLKNRRPDLWRDRQDHAHSGALDVNLTEVRGGIASKLDRIASAIETASVPRKP